MRHILFTLFIILFFFGCEGKFPKDPEDTLTQARDTGLVVGYSHNPPWVIKTDTAPGGIEPELVQAFASAIGTRIIWKNDTEHNLFEDLEKKKIHLLIAGIRQSTPWKTKVALTRPYLKQEKEKYVMASIQGENAFLVALERFLHGREQQIKASLPHETDQ